MKMMSGRARRLCATILLLLLVVAPVSIVCAAQLFEQYNEGTYLSRSNVFDSTWRAQTFAAQSDHSVTSVRLPIDRDGQPGDVTVSIQGTDVGGHPDGVDLASETVSDTTFPLAEGSWTEIAFSTPFNVAAGQKYAIVVRAPAGNYPDNRLLWSQGDSAAYGDGNSEYSANSGSSWSTEIMFDLQFEVYGEQAAQSRPKAVGGEAYPVDKARLFAPFIVLAALVAGAGLLLARRRPQS